MSEPTINHTPEESLRVLLRAKERQLHDLQRRVDQAGTILSNALIVKRPRFRREVSKVYRALYPDENT